MTYARLPRTTPHWLALSLAMACCLPAYAQASDIPEAAASAPGSAASAPAAASAAGQHKPFADIIKGAHKLAGYFTLWRKDDKTWLELRPEQLNQPFFFSVGLTKGIGERALYGGQMGKSYLAVFRKSGSQIQLVARNTRFFAQADSEIAQAVDAAFSDSLLASAPSVSAPEPSSGAVLVDADALWLSDIPMGATRLESTFRQAYALDRANSRIEQARNSAELTGFAVSAHYSLARIALPPLLAAGQTPPPHAPLPQNLTDVRSLFLGYYYSLRPLPTPMPVRLADPRVGHFWTTRWDYSDDMSPSERVRYVNRWRLEKKDPAAALSEPVQPIVYWLDRNIPARYRKAVSEGVLEWNKAFEKLGFKNAVQVRQQSKDDDFDTADAQHASIRWFLGSDVGFAIGPSQVDPRTGEILDADIAIADVFSRSARRRIVEEVRPKAQAAAWPEGLEESHAQCSYAEEAAENMHFALDLMEARGELAPDSPEAEQFIFDTIKSVVIHEVGHTLGLRHNFKASTAYTPAQLGDRAFTERNGTSASVMDYNPINLAPAGKPQGGYQMTTLGPYDYWAIEYAYTPLPAGTQSAALSAIAARSSEDPRLTYGTDEDAGWGGEVEGVDPEANRFDATNDPLAWYQTRIQLSQELWQRLQARVLKPNEDRVVLRRNLLSGLSQVGLASSLAAKYVGGMNVSRDLGNSTRASFVPVAAARQRATLKFLAEGLFAEDSFRFKPEFVRNLGLNQFDRSDLGIGLVQPGFSLTRSVLSIQTEVLNQLMSDSVAQRILDAGSMTAEPFRLAELHSTLQAAIWSELHTTRPIGEMRRNLQREHLKRVVALITRASGHTPADVVSLNREFARQLSSAIHARLGRGALAVEDRAHLNDAAGALDEALKASFVRSGV